MVTAPVKTKPHKPCVAEYCNGYLVTGNHAKNGREYHIENSSGTVGVVHDNKRKALATAAGMARGDLPDPAKKKLEQRRSRRAPLPERKILK